MYIYNLQLLKLIIYNRYFVRQIKPREFEVILKEYFYLSVFVLNAVIILVELDLWAFYSYQDFIFVVIWTNLKINAKDKKGIAK